MSSLQSQRKQQSQLLVSGYVREYKSQYIHMDIIRIIHAFHYIIYKILELYSIGENRWGQQGNGRYMHKDIKKLTKIKTFKKQIKNIVTCYRAAYILFDDGTYECCGYNEMGVLGIGHFDNMFVWQPNEQIKDMKIKNIFSAPPSVHSFCISDENKLYAVGRNCFNEFGQLEETNKEYNNKWTPINTSLCIQKVATALRYTIFLSTNGTIFVAGYDAVGGVLGLGGDIESSPNIQEILLKTKIKFKDIYCGRDHTLAIDDNYGVWSWGYGADGGLGHGDNNCRYLATRIEYFIENNIKIGKICCGFGHNILLSLTNKIYCFGQNNRYQCGNGSSKDVYLPQANETLKKETIIDIKCGQHHNIIKTADNKYYLWGDNQYNQCLHIHDSNYNPPNYIKKPLLFNSNYFVKDKEIIHILPGCYETRIIIGL